MSSISYSRGWPAVTFGTNHDGTVISNDTHREGMEQYFVSTMRGMLYSISYDGKH